MGVGDTIRTRKNWWQARTDKGRPVVNGATWTVSHVTDEGLWVHNDELGRVLVDNDYLNERIPPDRPANNQDTGRPTIELGYASTLVTAQGRTVDHSLTLVDHSTGAEAFYVGMTRGRETNLVIGEGNVDEVADLARAAVERPLTSRAAITQTPTPAEAFAAQWQKLKELWDKDEAERQERWDEWRERRDERLKLTRQGKQLENAVASHDQDAAQLGRLAKRRGRQERAEKRTGLTEQITQVEERHETLRKLDDTHQAWRAKRTARREEADTYAERLDAGLNTGVVARAAIAEYGVTIEAAEAIVRYDALETARQAQEQAQTQEPQQRREGRTGPGLSL